MIIERGGRMPMHLKTVTMAALVAGFSCIAVLSAQAGAGEGQGAQDVPWPTKAWPVSTPEEQGMDSARLARLIETVGTYKQDSFMQDRGRGLLCAVYRRRHP
jgi:hypothetical protein